jgi:mediator of RNA polymerase II transcription subunit 31
MAATPASSSGHERFVIELEFVQSLANFGYLHSLAQRNYFEDEAFLSYLRYLRYWTRPAYVTVIGSTTGSPLVFVAPYVHHA